MTRNLQVFDLDDHLLDYEHGDVELLRQLRLQRDYP
jgi:hypothetical protein